MNFTFGKCLPFYGDSSQPPGASLHQADPNAHSGEIRYAVPTATPLHNQSHIDHYLD